MANYGAAPYEEAAAKGQARMTLLQRIGQAFAGAGYGVAASQNAQNPLEALGLGFAGSYGKVNAARQAAEEYAAKKIEAENARQFRDLQMQDIQSQIEARAKARPEAIDTKQRDYGQLIQQGLTPAEARQIVYGLTGKEQTSQKLSEKPPKAQPDADAVSSLADAMHSMGYAALQGLGMGAAGLRESIVAEHARKYPNDDLAQISANYRALSGTLGTMQRGVAGSEGFAETAKNAMGLLDSTIGRLPDTGIVPLNFVLRSAGRAMGNEDITAFDNARQVVNTELGRILGQGFLSNGTQLTDSMRHEIREGMSPNATRGQLRAALGVLRTDLGFKMQAGQGELNKIRSQIGRGSATADSADPFMGLYK